MMNVNPGNYLKERLITSFEKYLGSHCTYLGTPTKDGTNMIDWKQQPIRR